MHGRRRPWQGSTSSVRDFPARECLAAANSARGGARGSCAWRSPMPGGAGIASSLGQGLRAHAGLARLRRLAAGDTDYQLGDVARDPGNDEGKDGRVQGYDSAARQSISDFVQKQISGRARPSATRRPRSWCIAALASLWLGLAGAPRRKWRRRWSTRCFGLEMPQADRFRRADPALLRRCTIGPPGSEQQSWVFASTQTSSGAFLALAGCRAWCATVWRGRGGRIRRANWCVWRVMPAT